MTQYTITEQNLESLANASEFLDTLADAITGIAKLIDMGDQDAAASIASQFSKDCFATARDIEDVMSEAADRHNEQNPRAITDKMQRELIYGNFQPQRDKETIQREACMMAAKICAAGALKALAKSANEDPTPHDPVMVDQAETYIQHMLEYLDASGTGTFPERVLNVTARRTPAVATYYPEANKLVAGLTGIDGDVFQ